MTARQPATSTRLAQAGLRATRQRLLVLETLAAEPHDATAQEIYSRLRQSGERVGLATVYRTLSLLSEHGVVDEFAHRPGETCYRLCGEGHHHHLVCDDCGRVDPFFDPALERALEGAASRLDYGMRAHEIVLHGSCGGCLSADQESRRRDS